MYNIDQASYIEALLQRAHPQLLQLRAELCAINPEKLQFYLSKHASDNSGSAQIWRLLVLQAINSQAAAARVARSKK